MRQLALLLALLGALASPRAAGAHEVRPGYLDVMRLATSGQRA